MTDATELRITMCYSHTMAPSDTTLLWYIAFNIDEKFRTWDDNRVCGIKCIMVHLYLHELGGFCNALCDVLVVTSLAAGAMPFGLKGLDHERGDEW